MSDENMNLRAGDANRITRDYFETLLIETRYIDAGVPDPALTLYGESFSTPVMTAALSHLDRIFETENGMVETARGAALANAVMWAGMGSDEELDAMIATGAKVIKIIKPYADRQMLVDRMSHAEQAGALAVGVDIDHSFGKTGQPDRVFDLEMKPVTSEDLRSFVQATSLPFIVKGVLSVQDAVKCADAGVQGIVVSHHHGIMDYSVPPLLVLPDIVAAVGGRMPIFVDCGIDRGMDAFKAMALGATAVSVGRTIIADLKREGAEGVQKRINDMTGELTGVMARTGMKQLGDMNPDVLRSI